jgi:multidrug resistance protein, MATE family
MLNVFKEWKLPGGGAELLKLAWPLILSSSALSILGLIDRILLAQFDPITVAAALPAGSMNFSIAALFLGTAGYTTTLIATSIGMKKKEQIGPILWQGIWFSISALLIAPILIFTSPWVFGLFDHSKELLDLELPYYNILAWAIFPMALAFALSGYFSAQGRTWVLFWANTLMCLVNGILDYVFIFGWKDIPEMGIQGAAYASVISQFIPVFLYIALLLLDKEKEKLQLLNWRFDKVLTQKLLKFGVPAGFHFFLDIISFTLFMMFIGNLGESQSIASNIAFQIHIVAFLPSIGLSIALSILASRTKGTGDLSQVGRPLYATNFIVISYSFLVSLSYIFGGELLISPFQIIDPNLKSEILILLFIAAGLTTVDFLQVMYSSILKGLGDTRFVSLAVICTLPILLIPATIMSQRSMRDQFQTHHFWLLLAGYLGALFMIYLWRWKRDAWKKISIFD